MFPLSVPITTSLGFEVPTSEHAYMGERFKDPRAHMSVALSRGDDEDPRVYRDGLAAKTLAYELIDRGEEQIDDFDVVRTGLMYTAVRRKFVANHDLARMLLDTTDEEIVEGNDWGDRYWGVDPPGSTNGENNLGKVLMLVRSELQEVSYLANN